MVLPFVRDLFADVEKLPAFARVTSHLREGTGRLSVSGLTPTAKTLFLVLWQRATGRPLIVVVPDNRTAEDMVPVLQAFHDLTGGNDPNSIVSLPTRDVLPFQNLSPHPEIQEERAVALWKIASGAVSILVVPVASAALRLRSAEYYADLARVIRRSETLDIDPLLAHLNTVGYSATDVVEMPGEYASRGGILDVYSPEADRPLRIEFFGDEVESIRKFDPTTQRSSTPVDEALLLPLTETPVTEELLGAIHARLSGRRITGAEEVVEQAVRSGGVTVFPGWEFYAPVAGADRTVFDLMPRAAVLADEPDRKIGGKNSLVFPEPTSSISKSRGPAAPNQLAFILSPLRVSTARSMRCWKTPRSRSQSRTACSLLSPTLEKLSAWPTSSARTAFLFAWAAAPAAVRATPTRPRILLVRSTAQLWPKPIYRTESCFPTRILPSSALAICLTSPTL
jgi:transcription-repair coupling factor (superfamily II helicase)